MKIVIIPLGILVCIAYAVHNRTVHDDIVHYEFEPEVINVDIVDQTAFQYNIDPKLVRAMIYVESRGKQEAISPKGAIGLMQLMSGTAKELNVDPTDAGQNVKGGVHHLSKLITHYHGDTIRALAAYNCGVKHESHYVEIPETVNYVSKVMSKYNELKSE